MKTLMDEVSFEEGGAVVMMRKNSNASSAEQSEIMKQHSQEYFSHLCVFRLRCQPQHAQERTAFAEGNKPKP
jgi:hypothetical protein